MDPNLHISKEGLLPLPPDTRDLALGSLFRVVPIADVPLEDFVVSIPLLIKNQGDTDLCTAYTVTSVSEDQESIALSPEFQFAKIKQLLGNTEGWGADLRTACKSATAIGSITSTLAESYMHSKGIDTRDAIADWNNWPADFDNIAAEHRKCSYLTVEGPSLFDAIRSALWTHRAEHRTVAVGAKWRPEWTVAKDGYIPESYGTEGFGHAFKIFGQKMRNGVPYLVAQLSNGIEIGDQGIFYFPKDIVDREFVYGAFMFKDITPAVARQHIAMGAKVDDPWYLKIFKRISNIIK